jgi:enoyl-[acyl-carrier protein] reductase III
MPADQVVLITGGTRGIGRAIALRLAKERPRHIRLAYCMNHDAARSTLDEIRSLGVEASAVVCDVGDEKLQGEMFQQVQSDFGRLDVFVANAARTAFRAAAEIDMRSGGRIIGLSSLGSRYYMPKYAALGAAKAAIENLARYLAVELAPHNINVNVVSGGFIDTDSMKLIPEYHQLVDHIVSRTPAARLGRPDDLAGVVAFLCQPESDWIRGQTLIADGGYSLLS